MKLAADAKQNGRWVRDAQKTSSLANRTKAAKEVNPMSVAGTKFPARLRRQGAKNRKGEAIAGGCRYRQTPERDDPEQGNSGPHSAAGKR
jgi:transposase-like protein